MRFSLDNATGVSGAREYLNNVIRLGGQVDIKRVSPKRSLSQNNYLHLLCTAFGMHFGYTLEESKYIYKQINASTYSYEKKGRVFYRSSADLSKEEMQKTIDKFMRLSAEQGCPLPLASQVGLLDAIANEAEKNQYI